VIKFQTTISTDLKINLLHPTCFF